MFDSIGGRESRARALLKKALLVLLVLGAATAAASGYRAYYQVRGLELHAAGPALREGSVIRVGVTGSGRTTIDVRVELIQDGRAETLAVRRLPGNQWASFDPRPTSASHDVALTPEHLARFRDGAATLRATATGRPQWTRLPPPTVRELPVEVRRD